MLLGGNKAMSEENSGLFPMGFEDATDEEVRERILRFYREHPELTLKTLVCRAYGYGNKEYVALVTRGDMSFDMDKLCAMKKYKSVRLANPEEMKKLNLVVGYVSPIDCAGMRILGDTSITEHENYYDGGNRELLYRKNVNYPRDFSVEELLPLAK
jgi:prolyl-tRNA editing enzyme YbaK/EbsC (Cys-tRNA(Pro) deacylase)